MDRMKRIRVDDNLIQQIDYYDIFPPGKWSRRAKVDYLIRIGLAVLLEMFKQKSEEQPADDNPNNWQTNLLGHMTIARVLDEVERMRLPKSDLMKLLNRSLSEG